MVRILNGILTLALMFAVAGCEEQKAPETSDVRPVRTVVVNPKNVEDSRQAIGEIRPRQETELGFRVSGKLIAREVDVGDTVGKGRVLARLEEQDYRNKLQSAEADVTAAEAVLVEAQGAEGRQRKLLASGVTTRANHEVAVKNLDSAQAKFEVRKGGEVDRRRSAELYGTEGRFRRHHHGRGCRTGTGGECRPDDHEAC